MRPSIQFSCRVTALILAVLWLCQTPLSAAIYKWKDDQGKTHFTDDKSNIPLKYRMQLEKFKGVVDPSQRKSSPPAGSDAGSGEEATVGEEPPPAAGGGEQAPKPPQKSKYNEEQVALLKKVRDDMVKAWAGNVKLVKHIEPTRVNGKYYLASHRKFASLKKGVIKRIGGSDIPSLKAVKKFLKRSSVKDTQLIIADPPFMEKVQTIRKTIEGEIPIQKDLIEQLKTDIGPEEPEPDDPDAFIPPARTPK